MTLEQLLKMQIEGKSPVTGKDIKYSPEFRVAVQKIDAEFQGKSGIHVIIHANGHNSDTLDLFVSGNNIWNFY